MTRERSQRRARQRRELRATVRHLERALGLFAAIGTEPARPHGVAGGLVGLEAIRAWGHDLTWWRRRRDDARRAIWRAEARMDWLPRSIRGCCLSETAGEAVRRFVLTIETNRAERRAAADRSGIDHDRVKAGIAAALGRV